MNQEISIIKYLKENNYEEVVRFFESEMKRDDKNIQIKLKLSLLLLTPNIDDYIGSVEILNEIIKIDPYNPQATLLMGYIEDIYQGEISSTCLELINNSIKNSSISDGYIKYLLLIKSFFYRNTNKNQYFVLLLESLKYAPIFSYNYYLLYQIYYKQKDFVNALEMISKSISNISHIFKQSEFVDPTDFDKFIKEKISGTQISLVNYQSMLEHKENMIKKMH